MKLIPVCSFAYPTVWICDGVIGPPQVDRCARPLQIRSERYVNAVSRPMRRDPPVAPR